MNKQRRKYLAEAVEKLSEAMSIVEDAHDALNRIVAMMHDLDHLKGLIGKADIRVMECKKDYVLV